MEPFAQAVRIIAGDHLTVADLVAVAVSWFIGVVFFIVIIGVVVVVINIIGAFASFSYNTAVSCIINVASVLCGIEIAVVAIIIVAADIVTSIVLRDNVTTVTTIPVVTPMPCR